MSKIFGFPQVNDLFNAPPLGVGAVGTTGKIIIGTGAGLIGGALLFGGARQYLDQKAESTISKSPTIYNITPSDKGTVNIYEPSGATASNTQNASQEPPEDKPNYLLWALLGIGALYVFKKKR